MYPQSLAAAGPLRYLETHRFPGETGTDAFGSAVAIDGDTAVIGDPNYKVGTKQFQGSAFVYVRRDGVWTKQQQLLASDGIEDDIFGFSVAVSGDVIVVGAVRYFSNNNRSGKAYIFLRSGETWTEQQQLSAAAGAPLNYFGYSVSISGGRIAVGAFQELIGPGTGLLRRRGAVYLYDRLGSTWNPETILTAADGQHGDGFGCSVSLNGSSIAIGAYLAEVGTNSDQGAVYIFEGPKGLWRETARITAVDGAKQDHFGVSVALDGDTVVAGAPNKTQGTNTQQGAAYIYGASPSPVTIRSWDLQKTLILSEGKKDDALGSSVTLSGDVAVIGVGSHVKGAAYAFIRSGKEWALQQTIASSNNAIDDHFGWAVAARGEEVLIGAVNQRSVYLFRTSRTAAPVTVSAASYQPLVANESIGTVFGERLATGVEYAAAAPLPTTLAGTTVTIRDSAGISRLAPLFYVSPQQLNFQIPADVSMGDLSVLIAAADGTLSGGSATVERLAPGLFSADSSGTGLAAAIALRIRPGGLQSFEPVAHFDVALGRMVADPIDLGPAGERVFLLLFGTGVRNRSSLAGVTTTIGGQACETAFVGPVPEFIGLDQINILLDRSLAGRGDVDVVLSAEGRQANTVRVNIR
jgi:uncharacterized protein (TIGR03437 family)